LRSCRGSPARRRCRPPTPPEAGRRHPTCPPLHPCARPCPSHPSQQVQAMGSLWEGRCELANAGGAQRALNRRRIYLAACTRCARSGWPSWVTNEEGRTASTGQSHLARPLVLLLGRNGPTGGVPSRCTQPPVCSTHQQCQANTWIAHGAATGLLPTSSAARFPVACPCSRRGTYSRHEVHGRTTCISVLLPHCPPSSSGATHFRAHRRI
jgi:hypothetical protein